MSRQRLILALAITGLVAGCSSSTSTDHISIISAGYTNLAGGHVNVGTNEVTLRGDNGSKATINAGGDFNIDGKIIATDATSREQLQRYYLNAVAVRADGIATGKAGTAVAGQALKSVAAGLANGNTDKIEAQVNASAEGVKQAALKICDDMAGIKAAQDNLAAQLPAFKPYAGLIDKAGIDDCRNVD